ncbi:MAG: cytochrome c biogenesis protein CcsA [Kiloniellales bacterium]|nr:cytochrome c biogenesis protein CcsA [Kiloniellales bacterium]
MTQLFFHSLAATIALMPLMFLSHRREIRQEGVRRWLLLFVALFGAASFALAVNRNGWNPGFASSIWVSVSAVLLGYAVLAKVYPYAWGLVRLLMPYALFLALIATIWSGTSASPPIDSPGPWLAIHLVLVVFAYAAATLGAIAGFGVFLQERALKAKKPTRLSRSLPSVLEGESLLIRLLMVAELVLLAGIFAGISELYVSQSQVMLFNHKTVFSLLAFVVLGAILLMHARSGLRGKQAVRLLLVGYLFITLAFPGVKLVSDVILA